MKQINKRNIKLFKILNDEVFWIKFRSVCLDVSRITTLRAIRSRYILPTKKTLESFIEQDYKYITWDNRSTSDIILDLLSEQSIKTEI